MHQSIIHIAVLVRDFDEAIAFYTEPHLGARDIAAYAARLRDEGLLADGGRVLATHIAHDGNPPHPELAAYAATHGYEIAYDGLSV